ncbi:unnamed protein product [Cylicocyclus nassatus]|uniref:Activin types I and II receptor domain-containing protein n=1 Tax=Cylicocyclus nassatus TaxID=53992 RepID=A0AA36GTX8_CYLNA|nr:unnamed protein product [Cylicocyclus nassatus]
MFSFVPVVLLVAIIARTQALECYKGLKDGYPPATRQLCPPGTKHCYANTVMKESKQIINTSYGCATSASCKKEGCETSKYGGKSIQPGYVKMCCCASDGCNKS